jgi:hypothetical protein
MLNLGETEVFALRDSEVVRILDAEPPGGRWICVMARSVDFPAGEVDPNRKSDGAPVERAGILACHKVRGKWQWLQLSPITKEQIGDLMFDSNVDLDKWYYVDIT